MSRFSVRIFSYIVPAYLRGRGVSYLTYYLVNIARFGYVDVVVSVVVGALTYLPNTLIDFCLSVARPDKLEVFSFVLRAQTTTALAFLATKMHKNTIDNTA